jgi:hypothetical protein
MISRISIPLWPVQAVEISSDLRKAISESGFPCIDELQERRKAVDLALVSKSIPCIGQIAVKISRPLDAVWTFLLLLFLG